MKSPVFEEYKYSSSKHATQYIDAIQRAEFWSKIRHGDDDEESNSGADWNDHDRSSWHTLLKPELKTPRLMLLPYGSYKLALNADGSCCSFLLVDINTFGNLLYPPAFPFDGSTIIGAAELAGDITTKDVSTFLFPNTFLYFNGNPKNCCVLGFHSFDQEPGTAANGNLPPVTSSTTRAGFRLDFSETPSKTLRH